MSQHPYTRLFIQKVDVNPTVDDDITLGYEIGDVWINSVSGSSYQCVDVTAGAAVWNANGGGAPSGAAGGDLSGIYPNPSVTDDSHAHTPSTLTETQPDWFEDDPGNPAYIQNAPKIRIVEYVATGTISGGVTYNNGASGVGATLTHDVNGSFGTLNERVLVNDNSPFLAYNGIYIITDIGSPTTPWVFTRASDCDDPSDFYGLTVIDEVNVPAIWIYSGIPNPVIGTDHIFFFQLNTHSTLAGVTADQHHNRSHNHSNASDGSTLTPVVLNIPSTAAPAQTAEGQAVWDSDDDKLTIGDGSSRKTLMNEGAAAGGDLSGTYPSPSVVDDSHAHTNVTVTLNKTDIGLGNVDNVQQLPISYLDTDGALAANSDAKVASQKAVKTYVDGHPVSSDLVSMPKVGSPTIDTLTEDFSTRGSAGVLDGTLTYVQVDTGAHKVKVNAGEGLIRTTNDQQGILKYITWLATTQIDIPAPAAGLETVRFIGIEYNAGTPQVTSRTTFNWNWYDDFPLARVSYDGTTLHILNAYAHSEDTANLTRKYLRSVFPFQRESATEGTGGLEIAEVATRQLSMSSGAVWHGFNRYLMAAISAGTAFDLHYRNGSGGWIYGVTATQFPNTQYDDGTGTLNTMTNNKYACLWAFLDISDGTLNLIYGRGQYNNAADAAAEAIPDTPAHLTYHGRLIACIIFQKSASSASSIVSAWITAFSGNTVESEVDDAIVDAITTRAPSQNAVFDALALKAAVANGVTNGDTHDHSGGDGAPIVASVVTIADAASLIIATDVEAALQEIIKRTPVGFASHIFHYGFDPSAALSGNVALAAAGGNIAIPFHVPAIAALKSVSVYNQNGSLARAWRWDAYVQDTNTENSNENTLRRVATAGASEAFTPGAASVRTLVDTNGTTILQPGWYELVIQCTHASNSFALGMTGSLATLIGNVSQTKTTTNPNGATLDFVAATWLKRTAEVYGVRINCEVFGQATAF